MDPLFEFIKGMWWLVFPLFGLGTAAFGMISGHRADAEKRRHKQELERMKVETRLLEAGGRAAPPIAAPTSTRDQLIDLFAAHDEITARWLDYELDVAKLIAFPAMSDGRQPLTAAFLVAKRAADTQRPPRVDTPMDPERLAAYRTAVAEFGAAFDIAESDARRTRDAGFTADERARLSRAKTLLATALDESATAAERQLAYKRVRQEIDGLIAISPESISILESKVGREIEGATAAEDAGRPQQTPLTPPSAEHDPLPPHTA